MHTKKYTFRQKGSKEVCLASTRVEVENEARQRVVYGRKQPCLYVWDGHLEEPLPKYPDHEVSVGLQGGIKWVKL